MEKNIRRKIITRGKSSSWTVLFLLFFAVLSMRQKSCWAFTQAKIGSHRRNVVQTSILYAKAPASRNVSRGRRRTISQSRDRNNKNRDDMRLKRAEQVEKQMLMTLETMKDLLRHEACSEPIIFPTVRECNAALATFGDSGEFLRALQLFVKMRKAVSLANNCRTKKKLLTWHVPAPTLATYSTLMSRAIRVGNPRLALRLWNLMKLQGEFYSSPKQSTVSASILVPDVKAANILMNAHAKLANVEQAHDLMQQMMYGNGTDVPAMRPNLVTYNTLLDACLKAGELDAALEAKRQLDMSGLFPDAWTYTSLIATVARKASQSYGANDPSLGFFFLNEMKSRNIRPNGMTYSALIDACARCRRPDLALKGLRIMLEQKAAEQSYSLPNEVGAWTAAINACGKAGRILTARRLFMSMSNFGVKPNTITCGCLTDSLLRNGRTEETLEVLRYMKREGIVPSKVMYTSLMASAERLVQIENKRPLEEESAEKGPTKAIDLYTELIKSLMERNAKTAQNRQRGHDTDNELLLKAFLVFQEMKAVGATPDLACYNVLLRACVRAGDLGKARDVLRRIRQDGLYPNDRTWRELMRAAGKARRSDIAEATWNEALQYRGDDDNTVVWRPSALSFGALASAYLRHASSSSTTEEEKRILYTKVITMYRDVLKGNEERRLHLVGRDTLHANPRCMLLILQAVVGLMELSPDHPQALRNLGRSIVQLDCLTSLSPSFLNDNRAAQQAVRISQSWLATSD